MANELRVRNAKTLKFNALRPGDLFRFLRRDDLQDVWLRTSVPLTKRTWQVAVSLTHGSHASAEGDEEVYRIKEVRIISPIEEEKP